MYSKFQRVTRIRRYTDTQVRFLLLKQFKYLHFYGHYYRRLYILSRISDYRRGMGGILDLLTTCIHHSELHFTDH
jgi:hypothetical protein